MKHYINYSIVYTVLALVGGVFYLGYDVLLDSWIGFNEH
mgnify:CR=1 FL=1